MSFLLLMMVSSHHTRLINGWKRKKPNNHMVYHQYTEHRGEPPSFILRPVKFYKSALTRQVAEAVRIRRRGGEGAILNSKSEYNRCTIPRLQLGEEEDEEKVARIEQEHLLMVEKGAEEQIKQWEQRRATIKAVEQRKRRTTNGAGSSSKRKEEEQKPGKRMKRLKYQQIPEGWGEEQPRQPKSSTNPDSKREPPKLAEIRTPDTPSVTKAFSGRLLEGAPPPQGIPNTDSLSGVNLGIVGCLGGGTGVGGPPKPSPCDVKGGPGPPLCNNWMKKK